MVDEHDNTPLTAPPTAEVADGSSLDDLADQPGQADQDSPSAPVPEGEAAEDEQAPATDPEAPTRGLAPAQPRARQQSRLLKRVIVVAVWVVVLCLTVVCALMISAWLTGFRLDSGFPDVWGMVEWIQNNYLGN